LIRSGERLLIAALIAFIFLLLAVPDIGDAIRGIVVFLFGERGSRYIGTILGILSLLAVFGAIVRWILVRSNTETTLPPTPAQGTQAPPAAPAIRTETDGREEEVDRTRTSARRISRELSAFTQERREDDPFHRADDIPSDMDSPEYKAIVAQYDTDMQETRRLYRTNHLPDVARVRDAFADLGVTDPELDRLYENPRNYTDMRTLAARLPRYG
jgi:hypothetical protein